MKPECASDYVFYEIAEYFVCIFPQGVILRKSFGDSPEEFWENDLFIYFDPFYYQHLSLIN